MRTIRSVVPMPGIFRRRCFGRPFATVQLRVYHCKHSIDVGRREKRQLSGGFQRLDVHVRVPVDEARGGGEAKGPLLEGAAARSVRRTVITMLLLLSEVSVVMAAAAAAAAASAVTGVVVHLVREGLCVGTGTIALTTVIHSSVTGLGVTVSVFMSVQ